MTLTVHVVRHGESTWNVDGRVQGQTTHPELTARGKGQAAATARSLVRDLDASRSGATLTVWTSDLVRAEQTARLLAEALTAAGHRTELHRDPRLREQGLGDMEGRLSRELRSEPVPAGAHVTEVRWGGGESLADVHARVSQFLTEATAKARATGARDLVLVSHGDTIRVAVAVLHGLGHREVGFEEPIGNGEVRRITL